MKCYAFIAAIVCLLGCYGIYQKLVGRPEMLDGPGSVYVDREYRTAYANVLPFADIQGEPYLAVVYLGKGTDGAANASNYIRKLFASLGDEMVQAIQSFKLGGEDWFLIIPKYATEVSVGVKSHAEEPPGVVMEGEPFVVCCNMACDVYLSSYGGIHILVEVAEDGTIRPTDGTVWDVKNIENIL